MGKTTIKDFQSLHTLTDLAYLLGFAPNKLSYILYKLRGGPNGQYSEFEIKKRSGGTRTIAAPHTGLKIVQKKLAAKLQDIYMVKKPVHGFVRKRTILTNAENHSRKKYVFHIDLKDFFPSIHFGRVMGLFAAKPYEFKRDIAILIGKIACLNDVLPQGSPCSPVISNMVCAYLDKQLGDLSKNCGCFYTRYADDLTFSTNRSSFPEEIAIYSGGEWEPSPGLVDLIGKHSFEVNGEKTSMRSRSDRQIVTGIVVNEYPNIQRKQLKQVRSMLHDWKVNGVKKAQERYLKDVDLANREPPRDKNASFPNVVRGKLEHIRLIRTHRVDLLNNIEEQECIRNRIRLPQKGEQHTIYKDQYYKYFQRYEQLVIRDCGIPTILGEGETDWMHLKKAFNHFNDNGSYPDLFLNIHKHKRYTVGGIKHLKQFCNNANKMYVAFEQPVICVYDCDDNATNAEHAASKDGYIAYGNNVFSIVLPKPAHRATTTYAIEQLYQDADLLKKDKHGRRVFLSTEFDYNTGKHKTEPTIEYGRRARDGKPVAKLTKSDTSNEKVIDSLVCTEIGGKLKSLALSKMDFAISIMREEPPFNKMDFSGFAAVFDLIKT
jgi:RNA-directed DNA polymerase